MNKFDSIFKIKMKNNDSLYIKRKDQILSILLINFFNRSFDILNNFKKSVNNVLKKKINRNINMNINIFY